MSAIHGPRVSPTLDLNFARNKSLVDTMTGRNLIDFSRVQSGTSKSTYFGADGILKYADSNEPRFDHDPVTGESLGLLVEEARTNLHLQSQDFSTWVGNSTTAAPNSGLAPDGTYTANLVQEKAETNLHYIQKPDASVTSGTTYTFSVFLKKGSGATAPDWITLALSGNGFPANGAAFNIATGQLGNTSVAVGYVISSGISEFPGGWYRCHVTVEADETRDSSGLIVFTNNQNTAGLPSYTGQTTNNVYAWGAQLEAGSFPTSYIPTIPTFTSRDTTATYYDANGIIQTAGVDVARDNAYFPDENGVMRPAGLLLEAAGTNDLQYSEDFTQSTWTKTNTTVTTNAGIAPDGTNTANFLAETAVTNYYALYYNSLIEFTKRTSSVYVKGVGRDYVVMYHAIANRNYVSVMYDLVNLTFDYNIGSSSTYLSYEAKIEALPNGWRRISLSVEQPSTSRPPFYLGISDDGIPKTGFTDGRPDSYTGDPTKGLLIWGAQSEDTLSSTSYIPTDGTPGGITRAADVSSSSTIQRTADVAQITGSNFSSWYNQSEGTTVSSAKTITPTGTNACIYGYSDAGNGNRMEHNAKAFFQFLIADATVEFTKNISNYVQNQTSAASFAYKLNSANVCLNGTLSTEATSVNLVNPNRIHIGSRFYDTLPLNGTISRLTYYPERLPDTTLQKLTR